jgi:hypothetical protein
MAAEHPYIALVCAVALMWCVGALLVVWPLLYVRVKQYLLLPLRSRGEAASISKPLSEAELERMPKEQREAMDAGIGRLEPLGFSLAVLSRTFSDTSWAAGATLLNERETVAAQVVATRTELPNRPPVGSESVAFFTEFTDESDILTTNFGVGIFKPDPLIDTVRWPGMRDLEVLYRFHTARVARDRGERCPKLPPPEAVLAHLGYHDTRTFRRQVDAGYMWFDADDEVFRRTLKGAFVFHWKLLWPWKQIRAAREERKLRRVLREVGMGTPEDYSPNPKDEVKPALAYHSALVQLPQTGDDAAHAGS